MDDARKEHWEGIAPGTTPEGWLRTFGATAPAAAVYLVRARLHLHPDNRVVEREIGFMLAELIGHAGNAMKVGF
jgi:hypothetical protein